MTQRQKHRTVQVGFFVGIACLAAAAKVLAESAPSINEHADVLWQVIGVLVGTLNLMVTGAVAWMLQCQKEIFTRLRIVEGHQETATALCEERHQSGGRRKYDPPKRPDGE